MKTINIILVLIFISGSLFGQHENYDLEENKQDEFKTLFGPHTGNGGYAGISVGYTQVNDIDAVNFSGRGGIIIGHSLAMGITGSGFVSDYFYDYEINEEVNIAGGYGGFFIEPILFPKFPVHLSFPATFAVGGMAYSRRYDDGDEWDNLVEDTEVFLLAEPAAELEFNLTRYFRLALATSYRFTTDLQLVNTPSDALEGFNYQLTLKFGKF